MDVQVVVLAGGSSKKFAPLVSEDFPKALLPGGNRPVLYHALKLLDASNLNDLIVVVEGSDAAFRVRRWILKAYVDHLRIKVVAVPEDVGTAGALRAVAHHLTATDVLIVSGDLVCDVSPWTILTTHIRHGAVVTTLLCNTPVSTHAEPGSSGGKDKEKKPVRHNIVGLDPTRQFLLHIAAGAELEKDSQIQMSILRSVGQMEIRSDLMDAHMYAFKRSIFLEVLDIKKKFRSIRHDVLPYLVRTQLRSELSIKGADNGEEILNGTLPSLSSLIWRSLHREIAPNAFQENVMVPKGSASVRRTHKCCAYVATESNYCVRLNSIQAFYDIISSCVLVARDCFGYVYENANIHSSVELGTKTTVGLRCMLDEGSKLGDKCIVKRSFIGRHCRIGSNVKIVNSVVRNHVTVGDGCLIHSSVVYSNVQLQERVALKDCQVGPGCVVTSGCVHKSESLMNE